MKTPAIFARLFARPETKGLADPTPDVWAFFGLQGPSSGVALSAQGALEVPAVASAVRLISEAVACLDCRVMERRDGGTEAEAPDHPANEFLRVRANDWTSAYELIRDLVIDALTDDRGGLVHVTRNVDGRAVELIRYKSGVMGVEYDPVTNEPKYRVQTKPVDAGDVLHLRAPFGRSPLTLARRAISIAWVLDRHAEQLFSKGARPSGALIFPKGMGEDAVKKAIAAWRMTHEADGESGKTAILYDGADFKPFTFASTDAQFLENRKFQIIEIARHFRVPPSMVFDLDRATWGNAEQMGQEFLTYCLEPWLRALEGAFQRALFPSEDGGRFVARFDRDDLTRADLATRATAINSLIASRVINPNEGRAWIGLGPRKGGEEFENPNINPDQGGQETGTKPGEDVGAGNATE